MPDYRRAYEPGGTFFFTVVTHQRRRVFDRRGAVDLFRAALLEVRRRRPFDVLAGVVLPDHVHCIWRLPEDDTDFSTRWRLIKMSFTRAWLESGGGEGPRGDRRQRKGERGMWQHRFWEHTIRSDREFRTLCDYIHYNPVKHGHASCPHAWAHSSFERFVADDGYPADWCCVCEDARRQWLLPQIGSDITGEADGV